MKKFVIICLFIRFASDSILGEALNLDIFKWPTFAIQNDNKGHYSDRWDMSGEDMQFSGSNPIQKFARFRDETFKKLGKGLKTLKSQFQDMFGGSDNGNNMYNQGGGGGGRGNPGYAGRNPSHYGSSGNQGVDNSHNNGYFEIVRGPPLMMTMHQNGRLQPQGSIGQTNPSESSYSSLSAPPSFNPPRKEENRKENEKRKNEEDQTDSYGKMPNAPLAAVMVMGSLLEDEIVGDNNPWVPSSGPSTQGDNQWTPILATTTSSTYKDSQASTTPSILEAQLVISTVINGSFLPSETLEKSTSTQPSFIHSSAPEVISLHDGYLPPKDPPSGNETNEQAAFSIVPSLVQGPYNFSTFEPSNLARGKAIVTHHSPQENINTIHLAETATPLKLSSGEESGLSFGSLLERLKMHVFIAMIRRTNLEGMLSSQGILNENRF